MKRDREKLILFPHQYWRLSRLLVPLILQKERKKYLVSFVKEADSISSYCDKKKEYFFAQSNWAWEYCSQSFFHLKAHQMLSLQTFLSRKGPYTHWGKNPKFIRKFTFWNYHFWQKSHFQRLIYHKIHNFKI